MWSKEGRRGMGEEWERVGRGEKRRGGEKGRGGEGDSFKGTVSQDF